MSWISWVEILLIMIGLSAFAIPGFSFAPWVPTRRKDLVRVLKLAHVKQGERFFELGCGNGRVSCFVANQSSGRVTGIELSSVLYLICLVRGLLDRTGRLSFYHQNLFGQDLSQADVVYFFGMPDKIKDKLKTKLERELKIGARVISYVFPVEGWTPTAVDQPAPKDLQIFFYQR